MKINQFLPSRVMVVLLLTMLGNLSRASVPDILSAQGFYQAPVIREQGSDQDYIKVEINGSPFTLLIDTGAAVTTIRASSAKRAKILPERAFIPMMGMNGPVARSHPAHISSFTIHGVAVNPGPVIIASLEVPDSFEDTRFDGVLGLATMKLNHVVFGYAPAFFFFQPHGSGTGKLDSFMLANGFARVSLTFDHLEYLIPISFNKTPGRLLLDSGAGYTFLSLAYAQRAGLQGYDQKLKGIGADGNVIVSVVVNPKRIDIGPLRLPTVSVTAGNAAFLQSRVKNGYLLMDGVLGFDFVGRLYPLLDTGNNWLYVFGFRPTRDKP